MHHISKILLNQGYFLSETIKSNQFNAFITGQKWKFTLLHFVFLTFLFFSFVLNVYLIVFNANSIINGLLLSVLGILISFFLIPIHECIHYLMFKFFGAKKVVIKPYFRQLYFLTMSHHFQVGKREIKWIALMPFLLINILGYLLLFLSNPPSQIILVSAILFHTSICSSDFRIVDFFWNSEKENIMFTDIDEEITYLFSR